MSSINLDEILSLFPDFKNLMFERIKEYDDTLKIFFERALTSIDYMQNIP
jgi:hypothetical protein